MIQGPDYEILRWIAAQQNAMELLTEQWANINSGSYHVAGLRAMGAALSQAFAPLRAHEERLALPPLSRINAAGEEESVPMAEALLLTVRPQAPVQVLLMGHMDTVYGPEHPFQTCTRRPANVLGGPGVADLKGGLVVMLHALLALERSPLAEKIGYQVLLNPDEEIGSIGSDPLMREAAKGKRFALIYEPAIGGRGALAGARKGSGNFTFTVRGRAAHAGRNPQEGRNAVVAAAELAQHLAALTGNREGLSINIAKIEGGAPFNVVPDLAVLRVNVRVADAADMDFMLQQFDRLTAQINAREGYLVTRHGHFTRVPKPLAPPIAALFAQAQEAAGLLGFALEQRPSGGCCDGNNLWHHGLPNLDTMGVRGANIHSDQEICYLDSLTQRAQLSALMLLRAAEAA